MKDETFHQLFDHMAEGVAFCRMLFEGGRGLDWIYLSVNGAFEKLTGLKHVVGKRVTEVIPGVRESDPGLFEAYARVSRTKKSEKYEVFVAALQEWFSVSVYSPQTGFFVSIFDNITERKRAAAALETSEKKYRRLFESMMDGFVSVGMDGKFLECNEVYRSMLGYSRTELAQLTYTDITPEKWHAFEVDIVENQILKRGYSDVYEKEYRRKDGSIFPVELLSVLIRDEQGTPASIWAIVRDITVRKRAEEDLLRKNAELEGFTYTVSHDLKSPLVTIKTFLCYLEEDLKNNKTEALAKDLGYLHGAADKMERLLDELLKLARIGNLRNPPVTAPLQELASEALELVAGQIAECHVQVEITREPVWLHGDRERLVQLFQNLLDNAVKFMGDQPVPRIEIGAKREGEEIVLFVRDNGKGIDPRHRSKLFGLFEKLDTDTPGSGMGLATVRSIVNLHGGKIHAQSDGPGKGTTFQFTLAKTELRQPT